MEVAEDAAGRGTRNAMQFLDKSGWWSIVGCLGSEEFLFLWDCIKGGEGAMPLAVSSVGGWRVRHYAP